MRRWFSWALALLMLAPVRPLAAQTLAGVVIDSVTRGPMRGVRVHAVDTSSAASALPPTTTDSSGVFYLDLRKPGTYRISFVIGTIGPMSGGVVTVGSEEVQRRFAIGRPAHDVYFETQVDKAVSLVPGRLSVRYPDELMQQRIGGQVILSFVVDSTGRIEKQSLKVLLATHPKFERSVLVSLSAVRYFPAVLKERRVRQLVQLPFVFCASREPCPEPPAHAVFVRAGWSRE